MSSEAIGYERSLHDEIAAVAAERDQLRAEMAEARKTVDALQIVAAVMRSFEAGGVPFDWPGVSDGAVLMSVDRWVKTKAHDALFAAGLIDCAECALKSERAK